MDTYDQPIRPSKGDILGPKRYEPTLPTPTNYSLPILIILASLLAIFVVWIITSYKYNEIKALITEEFKHARETIKQEIILDLQAKSKTLFAHTRQPDFPDVSKN